MEELIQREYLYQGRVLNLRLDRVRLPNGNESAREVAEHRGAVGIIAVDAEGRVILVRQYRHAVERELLEIPAGTLEPDEPPDQTASRELSEETGYSAKRWEPLGSFFPSPGILTEEVHLFLARDLAEGPSQWMDDEELEVVRISLRDALDSVMRGEIVDSKSMLGLMLAAKKLGDRFTTP